MPIIHYPRLGIIPEEVQSNIMELLGGLENIYGTEKIPRFDYSVKSLKSPLWLGTYNPSTNIAQIPWSGDAPTQELGWNAPRKTWDVMTPTHEAIHGVLENTFGNPSEVPLGNLTMEDIFGRGKEIPHNVKLYAPENIAFESTTEALARDILRKALSDPGQWKAERTKAHVFSGQFGKEFEEKISNLQKQIIKEGPHLSSGLKKIANVLRSGILKGIIPVSSITGMVANFVESNNELKDELKRDPTQQEIMSRYLQKTVSDVTGVPFEKPGKLYGM